ncbi:DUF4241 domain-containing protein [Riemerella anatipestifer]|uniref:DUF4241 domain-containing protein n=1 Tax=Riemerella anatipestifer TaxID=34085 RepID=UPI001AD73343|nr:DUF4241 domain-containing protein [Riemerella anatipestifer]MBO4233940.1 DUF4241 domain-containing protein [Riemerella anatipestifer]
MNHIKNIAKLFSKPFVESPLLETFSGGMIHLSSGELVACDPLITPDKEPFSFTFPKGEFAVLIHKEQASNCIAYVEIAFSEETVSKWELAVCNGQNIKDLKEDEIFGFPVETGMGCLMDKDTQKYLNQLEIELFQKKGDDFMGIYEEFFHTHFFDENGAIDQFASLIPNKQHKNNIIAFETGYGEGFYASYIGFNESHQPVKIISEFIEIQVD